MAKYALPITRKDFYNLGGFSNPSLHRKANPNGSWRYYKAVTKIKLYGSD